METRDWQAQIDETVNRLRGDPEARLKELARLELRSEIDRRMIDEAMDRIVDLERVQTETTLALLRLVADALGLSDADLTAFLLRRAESLRRATRLPQRDLKESPLADHLEETARELPPA